jgi:hypothetical protein
MDGNFAEMLQGVLSDPSAMEKIMGMAKNLSGGDGDKTPPPDKPPTGDASESEARKADALPHSLLAGVTSGNKERIALIHALRPYLSPERRKTADSLVKMLNMMKLADLNKLFKE